MCFSAIGISIVAFAILGCGKESVEYRLKVEFLYINATDSTVEFDFRESVSTLGLKQVVLNPKSSSDLLTIEAEGGFKKPNPVTCCQGILEDNYASSKVKTLILNNSYCVIQADNKSTDISNYESEIISDRHFRYTYTFRKADFENAVLCQQ